MSMNPTIRCSLCGVEEFDKSWLGTVEFQNKDYTYYQCAGCKSFICDPMPDEEALLEMYGNKYFEVEAIESEDTSAEKFDEVVKFLGSLEAGVFIDYGCGDGKLLQTVAGLGWKVVGVEFSPEVIAELAQKTSFEIISHTALPAEKADLIHLGDVLEHLTDLEAQMPRILAMLKTGGIFIAHGPLEANPSFFNFMLKISRGLKGTKITSIPPYHVILATTLGQRKLFERFGLSEINFDVQEVAFPAPYELTTNMITKPRQLMLFTIRKLSQLISRIKGVKNLGNRYFYIGRKS
jgi:SAM-dependent methyltransferase